MLPTVATLAFVSEGSQKVTDRPIIIVRGGSDV